MRIFALVSLAGAATLAACDAQPAAENTAANTLMPSAETRTGGAEPDSLDAAPVDAETAKSLMKERHDNYEKIGDAMKMISRELKSDSPDLSQVRQGADTIATLAPQIPQWFPPGTGPEAGKTEAKADIWQNPDDFRSKARAFAEEARQFQATAAGSDLAAIRAAHAELGKSCKACHDKYREKD